MFLQAGKGAENTNEKIRQRFRSVGRPTSTTRGRAGITSCSHVVTLQLTSGTLIDNPMREDNRQTSFACQVKLSDKYIFLFTN
jgi:hypothetical protein